VRVGIAHEALHWRTIANGVLMAMVPVEERER
jgi:hypothetical protein